MMPGYGFSGLSDSQGHNGGFTTCIIRFFSIWLHSPKAGFLAHYDAGGPTDAQRVQQPLCNNFTGSPCLPP
jgi:hypothetical protein